MHCRLEIIKSGLLTTIQDSGRNGLGFYAVPRSGYMDEDAADFANLLVANPIGSPVLEFTIKGDDFNIEGNVELALTGADMGWHVNGQPIKMNRRLSLTGKNKFTCSFAKTGVRSYLAIRGKWNIPQSMGSFSTCLSANIGPFDGSTIPEKEVIIIDQHQNSLHEVSLISPVENLETKQIEIIKGPEWESLNESSKEKLVSHKLQITPESNRMGARLRFDEALKCSLKQIPSSAVFPGVIQLPPNGQPIVVLQDGQTTGGYPRIAIIPRDQLSKFNQIRFGKDFNFYFRSITDIKNE